MIKVSSNINEFLKHYKKRVSNFKDMLENIAEKLAKRMSEDMYKEIQENEAMWAPFNPETEQNERGKMGTYKGKSFDFWFEINSMGENAVRVSIGEKIKPHEMSDHSLVNPAYFIEFGFGIIGQQSPAKNAELYGWSYNKNNHSKYNNPPDDPWIYEGFDHWLRQSRGAEGINFMYRTIDKYRNGWKYYLKELLEEQANG